MRAATGVRRGAGPGWVAGPDGRVASAASSSARDERRVGCSGQGLTPEQAERYQPWFDNARRLRELLTELEDRSLHAFHDAED